MTEIYILLAAFCAFIALGMEIALALVAAVVAALVFSGAPTDLVTVPQKAVSSMARAWPLLTIPIFIMLGEVFRVSGIANRIIDVTNILVGRLPGGLAAVNIVSSFFFGGISGSASADTAAIGGVMIPAMKAQGYPSRFATIVTITSSTLAPIVPPSILMILIAWVTEQSVGDLFLAGYVPGFLTMLGLCVLSIAISVRHDYPRHPAPPFREAVRLVLDAAPALLTPFIIVIGIVTGVVTVVESAALALAYSFVIAIFHYRSLRLNDLVEVIQSTVRTTAFVGLLLAFAATFSWLVTFAGLPDRVGALIEDIQMGPTAFMLVCMIIFLILGCFLNAGEIVIMTMPVLFPTAIALGIDPVHFSIVSALSMVIGNVTPPVGLCLFIGCSISGDRVEDLIGPMIPFIAVMVLVIVMLIFIPDLVLFVPRAFGYQ